MIKERIMQFLSKEGLSPSQFAEILGIQRSSISHILSGRNKPSYDFFNRLVKSYPNINLEWFFNGKGMCYKSEINDELPLMSINKDVESTLKSIKKEKETNNVTNVKSIKRILLLFTDGTFEVFNE